jgi:hypothetical protein
LVVPSESDVGATFPVLKKRLALRKATAAAPAILGDLRLGVVARWLAMEFVHGTKGLQDESPGVFPGKLLLHEGELRKWGMNKRFAPGEDPAVGVSQSCFGQKLLVLGPFLFAAWHSCSHPFAGDDLD